MKGKPFKSYCFSEYVLREIDEPETCGLIDRRGTSCCEGCTGNVVMVTRGTLISFRR